MNGQPVYCTAYAISGNNYVRLRVIGQAVGFDVSYDAATDSVQIRTGAQQAVQPTVAVLPTAATVSQRTAEAPAQPAVTPKSQSSGRDYSQDANPAIFTADLPREFYNSARHAYLNAEEMAAAFDRDLRKADTSLPNLQPLCASVTPKSESGSSDNSGKEDNYL